jgi:hypothetical protein
VTQPAGERAGDLPRKTAVACPWRTFLLWFADVWKPGQHMALIAPTDSGKTTFAVPVLKLRNYVLAFDPKGGDTRLALSGFERITTWPPPDRIRQDIAEGRPARLIVGGIVRARADRERNLQFQRHVLGEAFDEGGWTVYLDEYQILADRRMGGMDKESELLLISARDPKRMTIVTAYQAPAWVPRASTRQATWMVIWPTRDEQVVKSLAEKMGRDWREVLAAVRALPRHHVLVAGTDMDAPLVLTKAPALG